MAYNVTQLRANTPTQLCHLFHASSAGETPEGTAIAAPGAKCSATITSPINHFGWRGKVFDGNEGCTEEQDSQCRSGSHSGQGLPRPELARRQGLVDRLLLESPTL